MTATEKNSRTHRILSRLFAWDPGTRIFALSIFMTFMAFNVFWCAWTTFTPFSHFPLYLSAILFTLILTLPYAMWRAKWVQVLLLVLLDFCWWPT